MQIANNIYYLIQKIFVRFNAWFYNINYFDFYINNLIFIQKVILKIL